MSKIENLKVGSTTYDITPDSVSVKDIRDIAGAPSAFTAKEVSPFFTNQGMPTTSWHAGINVCGWSGDYNQWQLVGYANETDADNPLYFRNGSTSTNSWYPWRTILDSKNFSTYALPVNYNSKWTASWEDKGLEIFNTASRTEIGGDYVKIVREQAYGEDNLVISTNKITMNRISSYGSYSYEYTLPSISGTVGLINDEYAALEDVSGENSCVCVGLSASGEYDLTVYNDADGCGSMNTYKIIVPNTYSIVGVKPTIYQTSGGLFELAPPGAFVYFDLMTNYDDSNYNTYWIAITVGGVSISASSYITISAVNGTPAITDTYPLGSGPMDFFGDFDDALPINVIDLEITRISNTQIDNLFT